MMALPAGTMTVAYSTSTVTSPLATSEEKSSLASPDEAASLALMQNMFAVAGDTDNFLQEQIAKIEEAFRKSQAEDKSHFQELEKINSELRIALTQTVSQSRTAAAARETEVESLQAQNRALKMQAEALSRAKSSTGAATSAERVDTISDVQQELIRHIDKVSINCTTTMNRLSQDMAGQYEWTRSISNFTNALSKAQDGLGTKVESIFKLFDSIRNNQSNLASQNSEKSLGNAVTDVSKSIKSHHDWIASISDLYKGLSERVDALAKTQASSVSNDYVNNLAENMRKSYALVQSMRESGVKATEAQNNWIKTIDTTLSKRVDVLANEQASFAKATDLKTVLDFATTSSNIQSGIGKTLQTLQEAFKAQQALLTSLVNQQNSTSEAKIQQQLNEERFKSLLEARDTLAEIQNVTNARLDVVFNTQAGVGAAMNTLKKNMDALADFLSKLTGMSDLQNKRMDSLAADGKESQKALSDRITHLEGLNIASSERADRLEKLVLESLAKNERLEKLLMESTARNERLEKALLKMEQE